MSLAAITWAYAQRCGSPTVKAVLLKLADAANDAGICWPSLRTIADQTELSLRSVRVALRQLEATGMIQTTRRRVGKNYTSSVYSLTFMPTEKSNRPTAGDAVPPAGDAVPLRQEMPHNRKHEPSLNRKTQPREERIRVVYTREDPA